MLGKRDSIVAFWSEENAVLQDRGNFHYTSLRMFKRFLPDLKGSRILDVGCGHGMMMDHFGQGGNQVFGIDITPESVRYDVSRGLSVLEADARGIPFKDNTFDLVYSLGVIEHFTDTEGALREQVRVCKPGGIVVAVVPYLFTPLCPAAILFELLARKEHALRVTYGKAFSRRKFAGLFRRTGCDRIVVEPYYGSAFLRVLSKRLNAKLVDKIEKSYFSKYAGLVIWGIGTKRSGL